jgi:hypothetical protein
VTAASLKKRTQALGYAVRGLGHFHVDLVFLRGTVISVTFIQPPASFQAITTFAQEGNPDGLLSRSRNAPASPLARICLTLRWLPFS